MSSNRKTTCLAFRCSLKIINITIITRRWPVQFTEEDLERMEYLLAQSVHGIHLLFDKRSVAEILKVPTEHLDIFKGENITKAQKLLSDFIAQPSYWAKMDYLDQLQPSEYELIVRAYFQIVDNTVLSHSVWKH
jgi:hypothetical protein